ncbi:MAG TPA: efflux RND transporter periplasmic adaptor subunit [Clostridia bacterium]|nr:efflux RND transporter periplasmic adaptor subunit [Clostridia bacterium]
MKSLSVRKLLPWLLAATVVALVGYRVKFAPVVVIAHTIGNGEVCGEVMGTGTLEARVKTTISPRIQERLAEVLVDQGDFVKSGHLLARLDDSETRQQVAIAEATLSAARATVERVRADQARAEAVLRQTELDHQRSTELLAGKIAAQAEFDKTVETMQVAEADLKRSQLAIIEAERAVLTAEKNLLYQKEHLTFTEMRSPFDGMITRRDRDPGGVVVPGASVLQIVATNEIWVSAWVDETSMAGLSLGQPAVVVFRSESDKRYTGAVARLGRETDRETREFVVDVRVKELPENWTIGQRAEVFIETGHKTGVLLVPQQFVQWRGNKPGVFVQDKGRARWRPVSLGMRGSRQVEAVQGLSAGDQVVKLPEGQKQVLSDGQRVGAK